MENRIVISKIDDINYNITGYINDSRESNDNDNILIKKYLDSISKNIDNYKISKKTGNLKVRFGGYSELVVQDYINIYNDKIFELLNEQINKIRLKRMISRGLTKISRRIIVPAMFISLVASKIDSRDEIVSSNDMYGTKESFFENQNNINFTSIEEEKLLSYSNSNNDSSGSVDNSFDIIEIINYGDDIIEKPDFMISTLPLITDYIPTFGSNMNDEGIIKTNTEWGYTIEKYAIRYGLDYNLLAADIAQESRGQDSDTINKSGAIGLSQIQYNQWVNKTLTVYEYDINGNKKENKIYISDSMLRNPDTNIQIGAIIHQYCIEKFKGNIFASTLAYNIGEDNTIRILEDYCREKNIDYDSLLSDNYNYGFIPYAREYMKKNNIPGDPEYLNNVFQFFNKESISIMCDGEEITVYFNNSNDKENDLFVDNDICKDDNFEQTKRTLLR